MTAKGIGDPNNGFFRERRFKVILGPHISEKSSILGDCLLYTSDAADE